MDTTLAYIAGLFSKAIVGWMIAKMLSGPLDWALDELKQSPRFLHYMQKHQGHSLHCHDCVLGEPTKVDSLTKT